MKTQILDAIGETDLSRSARINAALAANERIKYCLTLLQLAIEQADHPERTADSLRRERTVPGVDRRMVNDLVAQARRENGGSAASSVIARNRP